MYHEAEEHHPFNLTKLPPVPPTSAPVRAVESLKIVARPLAAAARLPEAASTHTR